MRRTDRQINSQDELLSIVKEGKVIHIAFCDNTEPYIVTLNYGFVCDVENRMRFYFHSANEGRKINIIKTNPRVCFSITLCDPFITGDKACNYGMKYRSIVGYGTIRFVDDAKEKIEGLNLLMEQYTGKSSWEYDEESMKKTTVTCLEVDEMAGKRK